MLKRIRISVTAPVLLPSNLLHSATLYKISKTITFQESDIIVNEVSTTKLYDNNFTVDILNDDTLYISTQYIYTVLDENGEIKHDENGEIIYKYGTPSRISSLKGDQTGVKISDTIVSTPTIKVSTSYDNNFNGNLKITTSDFKMYSSIGKHLATTWIIKDVYGNEIFKRENDVDNLTSIVINNVKIEDNFIVLVSHHSDTNAESNYGLLENIIVDTSPIYRVKPLSKLIVGKYLYLNIELLNKKFKRIDINVYEYDKNEIILNLNNINNTLIKIDTSNFIINTLYTFNINITSENNIIKNYEINLFANDKNNLFSLNKTYLDKYDFNSLFFTNGETNVLSYQLSDDTILLVKNLYNNIIESKIIDDKLFFLNNKLELKSEMIINPNLYVNELLNGDVVMSYKLVNNGEAKLYIDVYDVNPETKNFTLLNSNLISSSVSLTSSGGITINNNLVYYIDYNLYKLVILNPYNGTKELIDIPYIVKYGISLVTDNNNMLYLLGGTNDEIGDYSITHKRHTDKVYKFDLVDKSMVELGTDLLSTINKEFFQFHLVFRHDNKITMFNNINNTNYNAIADQSTYILDLMDNKIILTYNDHLDSLPYNNTIVLKNGDVLRYSSLLQDPQKLYKYVSDSMSLESIDDNNSVIYDPTTLFIKSGDILNIPSPYKYDSIVVDEGGFVTLGDDINTLYGSRTLILTRDTIMSSVEFEAKGYTDIYMASKNIKFILLD